jgi:hypothetical protein
MNLINKFELKISSIFLFVILFFLPIDYFSLSANILREAGGKPVNVLLIIYAFFLIISGKNFLPKKNDRLSLYFLIILCCGIFGFFVSFFFMPEGKQFNRSPINQFLNQMGMFVLFFSQFLVLRYFFTKHNSREKVVKYLPMVIFIHLIFFIFEYLNFFDNNNLFIYEYFRGINGLIGRSSGLMSEPAYYGTFVGLYALPLIFLTKDNKFLQYPLSIFLLLTAFLSGGKTVIPVLGFQLIFYLAAKKLTKEDQIRVGIIILVLIPAALYMLTDNSTFDFSTNLSSVMRIGSNLLALNASLNGYGIFGVGFGQFHFLYLPQFAPDFLFFSDEAYNQFNEIYDYRASTFSLPIRLIIEAGLLGFMVFLLALINSIKEARKLDDATTSLGIMFIGGSIGFLLTQDTYCLPTLAFGFALIYSGHQKKIYIGLSKKSCNQFKYEAHQR